MAATGLASHARHVIGENPLTAAAFALFAMFIVLVAGRAGPLRSLATDAAAAMQPPSARHWFGTDSLGRDVLSRVMVAARVDFGIALSAVALSSVLGIGLGMLAGYYGGWFDRGVGRVVDTIMAFPLFVLAMGIVAALGNTVANIVLATAIINHPST
jgi:peptide/nickel transport system permease protein